VAQSLVAALLSQVSVQREIAGQQRFEWSAEPAET